MPEAKYSREEVAARGEAIFAQEIQGTLDSDNKGSEERRGGKECRSRGAPYH